MEEAITQYVSTDGNIYVRTQDIENKKVLKETWQRNGRYLESLVFIDPNDKQKIIDVFKSEDKGRIVNVINQLKDKNYHGDEGRLLHCYKGRYYLSNILEKKVDDIDLESKKADGLLDDIASEYGGDKEKIKTEQKPEKSYDLKKQEKDDKQEKRKNGSTVIELENPLASDAPPATDSQLGLDTGLDTGKKATDYDIDFGANGLADLEPKK